MEYPVSFKSDLVQKALGKGFEDFVEKYHSVKATRRFQPPTDMQYEVAEVYRKKGYKGVKAAYPKMPAHRITQAIARVSRYEWLNN